MSARRPVAAIVASVAAIALMGWHWTILEPVVSAPFVAEASQVAGPADARPFHAATFASAEDPATPHTHASSAIATRPGELTAFWYAGSGEGAADVAIYLSTLSHGQWSPQRAVVDRASAQASLGRHIRKLGNASVIRLPDGRLWLFFVTVSVGGWAGSAINLVESADAGQTWSAPRRLVTSPFLNVSTLVRTNPFLYADGSVGLPAYHEFIGKYGELLRIAPDGRVIGKERLSVGRRALQPDIVPVDGKRAVLLLRDGGPPPRHVLRATTDDGGKTWTEPLEIAMANPDAALDAVSLGGDRLLAVFNDADNDRERLILAVSDNLGLDWRLVATLADPGSSTPGSSSGGRHEYSYPWLLRDPAGDFHVLFTWNRERIRHVTFNEAWLDGQAGFRPASGAGSRP